MRNRTTWAIAVLVTSMIPLAGTGKDQIDGSRAEIRARRSGRFAVPK
jgi:hypothetical protein